MNATISSVRHAVASVVGGQALAAMEASGRLVVTTTDQLPAGAVAQHGRNSVAAVSRMVKDPGFAALLARARKIRQQAIDEIGDVIDCATVKSTGRDAWQMILRDASSPGKWRVQSFDSRGFFGHMTFDSKEAAIESAAVSGFTLRDDGALDRLFDTAQFQRGLFSADLIRKINIGELTFEQANALLAQYDEIQSALASVSAQGAQAFVAGDGRVMFLLADRIAAGSEAAVFLHEITHKWGRQVVDGRSWGRLVSQVHEWAQRPRATVERVIHDRAVERVDRAAVSQALRDEELFAYAVEEAVRMGVRPTAKALEGSAQAWLDEVVQTLQATLLRVVQPGESGLAHIPGFPRDVQQLVDLAYAMAQLESPERVERIWERLDPSQRDRLDEILSSQGLRRMDAGSAMVAQTLQATVAAAPEELDGAPASRWGEWLERQIAGQESQGPQPGLAGLREWLQALGGVELSREQVLAASHQPIVLQEAQDGMIELFVAGSLPGLPAPIGRCRVDHKTDERDRRVLVVSGIELVDLHAQLERVRGRIGAVEQSRRLAYIDYLHEKSYRAADDKAANRRLCTRLAAMVAIEDLCAEMGVVETEQDAADRVAERTLSLVGDSGQGDEWAGAAARSLVSLAVNRGCDAMVVEEGPAAGAVRAAALEIVRKIHGPQWRGVDAGTGALKLTPQVTSALLMAEQAPAMGAPSEPASEFVCDRLGQPIVVYRGEHSADGRWLSTRRPGLSFSTAAVANEYALHPNDRVDETGVLEPRIMAAHLTMRRPLVNDPEDAFIDFGVLVKALGRDQACAAAKRLARDIEQTQAWLDVQAERAQSALASGRANSVEQFVDQSANEIERLCVQAWRLLDDELTVQLLIKAGYDGAIFGGSGVGALEPEYRVFSAAQVNPLWSSDSVRPRPVPVESRVDAFLDYWDAQLDGDGPPLEQAVQFAGNLVREFARSRGVVAEFAPWSPFGVTSAIELTDCFADRPGCGDGSAVMEVLARVADRLRLGVYLKPAGVRAREFFGRHGFDSTDRFAGFMVRYPDVDDDDDDRFDGLHSSDPLRASYAGEQAQTAPLHSLVMAQSMIAVGRPAKDVRKETGWFCGPDGRWRFEIDDSQAKVRGLAEHVQASLRRGERVQLALEQVLDHPRLYAAYAHLASLPVTLDGNLRAGAGAFSPAAGSIAVGVAGAVGDDPLLVSVLLHEVQHAIQEKEAFAGGGSPGVLAWANRAMRPLLVRQTDEAMAALQPPTYESYWGNKDSAEGREQYEEFLREWRSVEYQRKLWLAVQEGAAAALYERLAGEVEARDVQARRGMDAQRREAVEPALAGPTASQLVVVRGGNEMHSAQRADEVVPPGTLEQVLQVWRVLGATGDIFERSDRLVLSRIVVPKEHRNKGRGTLAMQALVGYADACGKSVELTASTDFGASSKARLERFYRRFGFHANRGARRDFTTTASLLRQAHGGAYMDLRPPASGVQWRTYKVGETVLTLCANALEPGVVELQSIRTPVTKRGRGSAGAAMRVLLDRADRDGVTVKLVAGALDSRTSQSRLQAFFAGFGFMELSVGADGLMQPQMVRHAQGAQAVPEMIQVGGFIRPCRNSCGMFIHTDVQSIRRFWQWYEPSGVRAGLLDDDGRPLVLYHGTNADFQVLDPTSPAKALYATNDPQVASDFALYRRTWPGAMVMPVYARAAKVLSVSGNGRSIRAVESEIEKAILDAWAMMRRGELLRAEQTWRDLRESVGVDFGAMQARPDEPLHDLVRRAGFDAIVFRDVTDDPLGPRVAKASDVHVLLAPVSLKSAVGNLGDFDASEANILLSVSDRGSSRFEQRSALCAASAAMQWLSTDRNQLGPVYRGHGIELHAVAAVAQDDFDATSGFARFGLMGHAARCLPGTRTYAFKVVQAGAAIGSLVSDVDAQGHIVSVHDIATAKPGCGHGTRILSHLVANAPGHRIKIQEVTSGSEGFWRRSNIGYVDVYGDAFLESAAEGGGTKRQGDSPAAFAATAAHERGGAWIDADRAVDAFSGESLGHGRANETDDRRGGHPGGLMTDALGVQPAGIEVGFASDQDVLAYADDLGLNFASIGPRWLKDAHGGDLLLYHGTSASFEEFASNPRGIFFAENASDARNFSAIRRGGRPRVIEARVCVTKVWEVIRYGQDVPYSQMVDQSVAALKAQGFDAMHDPIDRRWVIFDPKQIDMLRSDIDAQAQEGDAHEQQVRSEIAAVRAQLRDGAHWLKAPNGKPTNLSPARWLMVRTPSFKLWFGDWQHDPQNASKALDENGEPKVYFHGSKEAGFTEFDVDPHGGNTSGTGAFFASCRRMACGYAGGYRAPDAKLFLPQQIFEDPAVIDGLEIEQGILAREPGKNTERWFATAQQARQEMGLEDSAALDWRHGYRALIDGWEEMSGDRAQLFDWLSDLRAKSPGIYDVFLNVRDPLEVDWQDAKWDQGPVEVVWDIVDGDGEILDWAYEETERDAMLARFPGATAVHREQQQYFDCNEAAREARRMGCDGILLQRIWDTGPDGHADSGDVAVVFDATNIKWADNLGTFDPSSADIRFSVPCPPARAARKPLDLKLEPGRFSKGYFDAFVGKRRVGAIAAWMDSRDKFVVMDVYVSRPFRRRGVATAMYRAVEEQAGKQLTPAVSLSDDGFEFWKAYRPEAVALDLRHRKEELTGRRGMKNGREGVLADPNGGTAKLVYPDGTYSVVLRAELDDVLLPPDTAAGNVEEASSWSDHAA